MNSAQTKSKLERGEKRGIWINILKAFHLSVSKISSWISDYWLMFKGKIPSEALLFIGSQSSPGWKRP